MRKRSISNLLFCSYFGMVTVWMAATPTFAQTLTNQPSTSLGMADDLGRLAADTNVGITVHLKLRDEGAFELAVDALYEPDSATYRKWMSDEDLARFAPTAKQLNAVRDELKTQGLTVTAVGPLGFSIRATGTASARRRG